MYSVETRDTLHVMLAPELHGLEMPLGKEKRARERETDRQTDRQLHARKEGHVTWKCRNPKHPSSLCRISNQLPLPGRLDL